MEIILKIDITAMDHTGQDVIVLHAGTCISAISTHYIAKNSIIFPFKSQLYTIEDLSKNYYIVYAKNGFRAISKKDCDVNNSRVNGTLNY